MEDISVEELAHLMYASNMQDTYSANIVDGSHTEVDDLTCAICLCQPAPVDLAIIKGCEHNYCVKCILHWTMYKEMPLCPQCKCPFNYLYVHRLLDGTIVDYAVEESVCLLKRATWFTEHMQVLDKGKALGARAAELGLSHDDFYDNDYDDEDDEIEQYYFSSAAGRARVVIGNRRFGENGFVRGGRQYARPLPSQAQAAQSSPAAAAKKGNKGKAPGAGSGSSSGCSAAGAGTSGADTGSSGAGSSGVGSGRTAVYAADLMGADGSSGGSGVSALPTSGASAPGDFEGAVAASTYTPLPLCDSTAGVAADLYGAAPEGAAGLSSGSGSSSSGSKAPRQSAAAAVGTHPSSGAAAGSSAARAKAAKANGRRAQRNARRAAADYEDAYLDEF